jgi:hypothetical protein
MKLSTIASDPSLAKSNSRSKYSYIIRFNKKEYVCGSHVETVTQILRLLAESKFVNLDDIEETERLAGFPLLISVTDLGTEENVKKLIAESIPKYKNRYAISAMLTVNEEKWIVCREWTCERVDKFVSKFTDLCNSQVKNKADYLSVERTES